MSPHLTLTQIDKRLRVPCLIRLGLINNQLKSLKKRFMGLIEDLDSLERHADLKACQKLASSRFSAWSSSLRPNGRQANWLIWQQPIRTASPVP